MHFNRDRNYGQHSCSICKKIGHNEGFCNVIKRRSRTNRRSNQGARRPPTRRARSDAVFTVSRIDCTDYRRFPVVIVEYQSVSFQVDTALDVTIMSKSTWQLIGSPALQPSSLIARSASSDQIKILGQRACNYSFQNSSAQGMFYVANTQCNLLGAELTSKMEFYAITDTLHATIQAANSEQHSLYSLRQSITSQSRTYGWSDNSTDSTALEVAHSSMVIQFWSALIKDNESAGRRGKC
ncbi:hypothetical protein Tcan_02025 [Toxocara canis]|uniref:Uncharacterized protein n=1 Tax=Toxocara canis TaxID=6265 RepID=A0A0B2VF35_TOXCA|nr:hypothetical protein Tcan_02025 [Toxocara canis]